MNAPNQPQDMNPDSQDAEDTLDADQQKAFESIMAQIESGETGAGADDAEKEDGDQADDDFAAELEKVATQADAAGDAPADEKEGEDPDDELDADQQKAFESIMAQIESGETGAGADNAEKEDGDQADDDFAAELEKVATQADAAGDAPADEKGEEDPDDELDADQQKAFESIMAQIESGEAGAGADDVKKNDDRADDDFAAELEMVATQADAADGAAPDDQDGDDPDDDLDEDQQKAFESIMAQIESGESGLIDEAVTEVEDKSSEAEQTAEQADIVEVVSAPADSQTVAAEGSEPEKPAAGTDAIADMAKVATPAGPMPDGSDVASHSDEKQSLTELVPTGTKAEKSAEGSTPAKPLSDREPAESPAVKAAAPLPQKRATAGDKKRRILIASIVVIAILTAGGIYYFHPSPEPVAVLPEPTPQTATPQLTNPVDTPEVAVPREPIAVVRDDTDLSRLEKTTAELNHLRQELIDKQTEIEDLRAYYRAGIESEMRGLVNMIGSEGGGPMPFSAARTSPRIMMGLQAIQRRGVYIDKLVAPSETLHRQSEELLYYSRKAGLLSLMAAKTSDIDVDGFIAAAGAVMSGHRETLSALNIDTASATPRSLETIWKDVNKRLTAARHSADRTKSDRQASNAAIWEQICQGDLTQKHRLTALSPEAARCLADWKGKDLFLNNLTGLSPEAAKNLSAWPGDWLGLNGMTELTPDVAVHLARWKGRGLSLNGLEQLSPRVVAILSEWQGQQIELINVRHMAHWENPNTRLFLSDSVKRQLNATRK